MLERFRLDGEVVVTVGGGNGIGRATAAALVEAGAAVALLDRDQKAVKETEAALRAGAEVEAYVLDITVKVAVESSFEGVNRRWGRLDTLFNNAGISIRHPTLALSLADWNDVVAVHMMGVFLGRGIATSNSNRFRLRWRSCRTCSHA